MNKFNLCKRVVFNEATKEYDTDHITLFDNDFKAIVGQAEYQLSLRDKSVATPIELTIVKTWDTHKEYLDERKNNKQTIENDIKVDTVDVKQHSEKTLNICNKEKLQNILSSMGIDPTTIEDKKAKLIEAILLKQNEING